MNTQHQYVIDWDKVKYFEDLVVILKSLELSFENPNEELKKICKFVRKSDGLEVGDGMLDFGIKKNKKIFTIEPI